MRRHQSQQDPRDQRRCQCQNGPDQRCGDCCDESGACEPLAAIPSGGDGNTHAQEAPQPHELRTSEIATTTMPTAAAATAQHQHQPQQQPQQQSDYHQRQRSQPGRCKDPSLLIFQQQSQNQPTMSLLNLLNQGSRAFVDGNYEGALHHYASALVALQRNTCSVSDASMLMSQPPPDCECARTMLGGETRLDDHLTAIEVHAHDVQNGQFFPSDGINHRTCFQVLGLTPRALCCPDVYHSCCPCSCSAGDTKIGQHFCADLVPLREANGIDHRTCACAIPCQQSGPPHGIQHRDQTLHRDGGRRRSLDCAFESGSTVGDGAARLTLSSAQQEQQHHRNIDLIFQVLLYNLALLHHVQALQPALNCDERQQQRQQQNSAASPTHAGAGTVTAGSSGDTDPSYSSPNPVPQLPVVDQSDQDHEADNAHKQIQKEKLNLLLKASALYQQSIHSFASCHSHSVGPQEQPQLDQVSPPYASMPTTATTAATRLTSATSLQEYDQALPYHELGTTHRDQPPSLHDTFATTSTLTATTTTTLAGVVSNPRVHTTATAHTVQMAQELYDEQRLGISSIVMNNLAILHLTLGDSDQAESCLNRLFVNLALSETLNEKKSASASIFCRTVHAKDSLAGHRRCRTATQANTESFGGKSEAMAGSHDHGQGHDYSQEDAHREVEHGSVDVEADQDTPTMSKRQRICPAHASVGADVDSAADVGESMAIGAQARMEEQEELFWINITELLWKHSLSSAPTA